MAERTTSQIAEAILNGCDHRYVTGGICRVCLGPLLDRLVSAEREAVLGAVRRVIWEHIAAADDVLEALDSAIRKGVIRDADHRAGL